MKAHAMNQETTAVRNNAALSRYELDVNGAMAFANYRLAPGKVIITHTETPPALRGRGIASKLVQGALEQIRANDLKVVAGCGFVVDYLQKHSEFTDIVA
jgi:predicted GNAT family acetyltransferase